MDNSLIPGDIVCFYEVLNPVGDRAGLIVKESRERSLDNYVQWAQQTQLGLPPGHTFYRAMWVKVTVSKDIHLPYFIDRIVDHHFQLCAYRADDYSFFTHCQ